MRVTKYSPFGVINKITVTGSLILNVDPTQNNQLANKASVDALFTNKILKAGDTLTSAPTQTTAPTQDNHSVRKIDVTNRITQADNDPNNLTTTQIDTLLNAKILKSGDTAQGILSYNTNYTADANLVTKKTIDNFFVPKGGTSGSGAPVTTGTVIEYGSSTAPSGYLRLNGASVSKTTYSDLYKVIGDTFAPPGPGAGVPWQSQCSFNSSTQSDITNWASANSLATATSQAASLVTKNYIYVLGGAGNNEILSTIQKASFDNDGKLTSGWNNVSSLPAAMYGMGYVTTKGRFYLIGGNNRSSVYSVPINTDGTLGDFRTETSLSAARESPICFVIKDKLYVVGGSDKNTVYRAIVNNDGTLSSWETLPNFPVNVINGKPLLIKNRIYIFSALYSNAPYYYYTTYDSDGNIGSWTDFSGIPNGIYESVIVCTDNYVFSIGGYDRANDRYTASAYRAPISADGSIGTWVQISDGPTAVTDAQVAIAGNKIYFIGGYNGNGGRSSVVYSATFNSGITDYAQYYTDQQNTSSTFNLPDYSSKEITSSGTCYYIKT